MRACTSITYRMAALYVFYIDIRSGGKGYEEFVQRAMEEDGTSICAAACPNCIARTAKYACSYDTLTGQNVEIDADMVVLALAWNRRRETADIAKTLKIGRDKDGFLAESHPKLKPVESVTAGIFLAGCAQAPRIFPRQFPKPARQRPR